MEQERCNACLYFPPAVQYGFSSSLFIRLLRNRNRNSSITPTLHCWRTGLTPVSSPLLPPCGPRLRQSGAHSSGRSAHNLTRSDAHPAEACRHWSSSQRLQSDKGINVGL